MRFFCCNIQLYTFITFQKNSNCILHCCNSGRLDSPATATQQQVCPHSLGLGRQPLLWKQISETGKGLRIGLHVDIISINLQEQRLILVRQIPKIGLTSIATIQSTHEEWAVRKMGCCKPRKCRKLRTKDFLYNSQQILNQTRGFPSSSSSSSSSVTLVLPPLDSETGWTGELWSKTNLLNWQN